MDITETRYLEVSSLRTPILLSFNRQVNLMRTICIGKQEISGDTANYVLRFRFVVLKMELFVSCVRQRSAWVTDFVAMTCSRDYGLII